MQTGHASSQPGETAKLLDSSLPMLREMLSKCVILEEDWQALPTPVRDRLATQSSNDKLLAELVQLQLLTDYQAGRISTGRLSSLIVGNYRILERIGAGAMGVVFKAEHLLMRRLAAIKVVPFSFQGGNPLLTRFITEMRSVAALQHPNIVAAFEAGKTSGSEHDFSNLYYFVMEYVAGLDLEQYVKRHGPLPPTKACDVIYQIASALAEAHQKQLIHRDIKPSNILITAEGEAKLTDFGLARHFQQKQLTQAGTPLGTIDYMAPEQAEDASSVDIRADIYGLGASMFWCLTGQGPIPLRPIWRKRSLQKESHCRRRRARFAKISLRNLMRSFSRQWLCGRWTGLPTRLS